MKTRQLRNYFFHVHRIIGLVVGLVFVITGLTGTALVFQREIVDAQTAAQFGRVIPQAELVSPAVVFKTVKAAYADRPDLKLTAILRKPVVDAPYRVTLKAGEEQTTVWVDPYTSKIMGSQIHNQTWIYLTLKLHYALLSGDSGEIVMGVVAGLAFVLSITGIALWTGWRKLSAGFKIKWNAPVRRLSFDLHNVGGIVIAVFLSFTAFTGFVWNFDLNPVVYALTASPNLSPPKSKPIEGQSQASPPLSIEKLLEIADAALPGAETTQISFPQKPRDAYRVRKKFPAEAMLGRSQVFVDRFSGKVLQVKNGLEPNLGDRVLASFTPLHYGTFWGIPSRILYLFVGLSPLMLFVTGTILWWNRIRPKRKSESLPVLEQSEYL